MHRVTFRVNDDLARALTDFAQVNGASLSAMLVAAAESIAEQHQEFDCRPVSEWEHEAALRWERMIERARALDAERRSRT